MRRLTPRECARLQGFPDTFKIPVSDTQAYRQFGNAVTVNVVEAIGKQIEKMNKELEGNTFRENLVITSKTMQGQERIDTAVQLTEGKNFRGNIINTSDFNKILKNLKKETGMDDKTIIINWAQAAVDKNQRGFEDGHYTVGNNVITVKDDQVIAVR